jgi:hypothetical protein
MNHFQSPEESSLDSALLLLSRKPKTLASLLAHYLPPTALQRLARLAGRRRPGRPEPADQIADAIPHMPKLRQAVIEDLAPALQSDAPVIPESHWGDTDPASFSAAARTSTLAELLGDTDPDQWNRAAELLEDWTDFLAAHPCAEPEPAAPPPAAKIPAKPSASAGARDPIARMRLKEEKLQEHLLDARHETAAIEERLAAERQRKSRLQGDLEEALAAAEQERMRATDFKRKLLETSDSSAREDILRHEAEECRHKSSILQQKLQMVEEERDDLRGVLEDHDRFSHAPDEDVPSFRDRPLTEPEQQLAAQLSAQSGLSLRILVVGGGERQLKHRDKLTEYADVMGFHSHWRMAEYQSWHREINTLGRDMRERFDALIILHWNRTTFTRKAREICDKDGAKPCLTCYYEGFTNLRESLQECLRQLLAGHTRGR